MYSYRWALKAWFPAAVGSCLKFLLVFASHKHSCPYCARLILQTYCDRNLAITRSASSADSNILVIYGKTVGRNPSGGGAFVTRVRRRAGQPREHTFRKMYSPEVERLRHIYRFWSKFPTAYLTDNTRTYYEMYSVLFKLTAHFQLVPRSKMVELYLHSPYVSM
jgi:hypothetical protein